MAGVNTEEPLRFDRRRDGHRSLTEPVTGGRDQRSTGAVIAFHAVAPPHGRRPAHWGLVSAAPQNERGRRAIVEVGGSHTVCHAADVPVVGDLIHGNAPAVVDRVRITRDGVVRVFASPIDTASVPDRRSDDADRRADEGGIAANDTWRPGGAT